MELDKILLSRHRTLGMDVLYKSGLLLTLFPELEGLEFLDQGPYHHLNALSHTLLAVEKMSWALDWIGSRKPGISLSEEDRLSLSYATLFHDLGKQSTLSRGEDGGVHFYRHEVDSCRTAEKTMERLRFPGLTKEKVLRLVGNHMTILTLSPQTKESALKKLVNRMGELTPLLVALTLADKEAGRGSLSVSRDERLEATCLRILDLYGQKEVVHPPSLVTGHDVMALGIEPGPRVGHLLELDPRKTGRGRGPHPGGSPEGFSRGSSPALTAPLRGRRDRKVSFIFALSDEPFSRQAPDRDLPGTGPSG